MSFRNDPVPLDCFEGQKWSLLFNLNAAASIERATGQNPLGWQVADWGRAVARPALLLPVLAACMGHLNSPPREALLGKVWRPEYADPVFYALMRSVFRYSGKAEPEIDQDIDNIHKAVEAIAENLTEPEAAPLPLQ
jgi:hypothetical protein